MAASIKQTFRSVHECGCGYDGCLCFQHHVCAHVRSRGLIRLTVCPCENLEVHSFMTHCVHSYVKDCLPRLDGSPCNMYIGVVGEITNFVVDELWSRVRVKIVACNAEGCQRTAGNCSALRQQLNQSVLKLFTVGAASPATAPCKHRKIGVQTCFFFIHPSPTPVDYSPTSPTYSPTSPG